MGGGVFADIGWALGDGREHGDDPAWDEAEAKALYELLEREVVPEFYTRDENGIPVRWVARIRESMARLTSYFSANRSVREYTEKHYLPAAAAYRSREADAGFGERLTAWRTMLANHWHEGHFGAVQVQTHDGVHIFEVEVYLGALDPDGVRVELYADARTAVNRFEQKCGGGLLGGCRPGLSLLGQRALVTHPRRLHSAPDPLHARCLRSPWKPPKFCGGRTGLQACPEPNAQPTEAAGHGPDPAAPAPQSSRNQREEHVPLRIPDIALRPQKRVGRATGHHRGPPFEQLIERAERQTERDGKEQLASPPR